MNKQTIISIALPVLSLLIITSFIVSTNNITGFVVLDTNITKQQLIDADVTLKTYSDELLPENALIVISLDDESASLTIKEFIEKTGMPYNYTYGFLPVINYAGSGFIGNYTYTLNLSQLDIDRRIRAGSHTLKTTIIYNRKTLFENKREINIK